MKEVGVMEKEVNEEEDDWWNEPFYWSEYDGDDDPDITDEQREIAKNFFKKLKSTQ